MKTIFLNALLIICFHLLIFNCAISQWEQPSNPFSPYGHIHSFSIFNNNIYSGCYNKGILYTTNSGLNWHNTSLTSQNVIALTSKGSNMFASLYMSCNTDDGVYISTNNGMNWYITNLTERYILCLGSDANNIYAGCAECLYPGGVYKSTDNGANWQLTALNNIDIACLTVNNGNIYAGCVSLFGTGGLYLSTNEGANWTLLGLSGKSVESVVTYGTTIAAGTYGSGVYISTNSGANWVQTSLNNKKVMSLLYSDNKLVAGTKYFGVYLSKDNGNTWIQKNEGMGNYTINTLLLNNGYLFAGTDSNGCWRRQFSELISIKYISTEIPDNYNLEQNYPNPFNPSTNIKYRIPNNTFVTLKVFDLSGKEICVLVNEYQNAGVYEAVFNSNTLSSSTSELSSGIYFYKLTVGNFVDTKKMLLVK